MYELIFNGTILSMDDMNTVYNWIYIKDGMIKDVGLYDGYKRYIKKSKKILDLKGRTVLPGFIDSHVYLIQTGLNMMAVDLSNAKTMDELLQLLIERKSITPKGELIRGVKFDELNIEEKRYPTRKELDKLFPDNPVWINRIEMHTSVVNSYALSKLNIPFNLPGIDYNDNVITGVVRDRANAFVRNYYYTNVTDKMRERALELSSEYALSCGITTVNAIEAGFAFSDKGGDYIHSKLDSYKIDVALFYQTLDLEKLIDMGLPRAGCIFLDGSIGSRTAALTSPYEDDDSHGSLYYTKNHLKEFVEKAHCMDFQISIHAVGNRAIDLALDVFEEVLREYPKENHRHRIEHFELPSIRAIRRMRDLSIIASMVPNAGFKWSDDGSAYDVRLGKDRNSKNNPFGEIIQKGVLIAAGSDSDITDMNPFIGIHDLVNSIDPIKRVSIRDALKMYTINGAYAIFEENIKGTIEQNKYADLSVVSHNPYLIDRQNIKDITVEMTLKKGQLVYSKEDANG